MTVKKGLILGVSALLLVALVFLKPLRFFDNLFYDLNFVFSAQNGADSVCVVGIDSKSIGEIGAMPWPRTELALLIGKISAGSPNAVGLDILFPYRNDSVGNDSLAKVFSRVKNLVLPFRASGISAQEQNSVNAIPSDIFNHRILRLKNESKLGNISFYYSTGVDVADTNFSKHSPYSGFLNVSTSNSSQKIREAIQVIRVGNEYFTSFGIAAVAAYYSLKPGDIVLDGDGYINLGEKKIPVTSYAASSFINFRNDKNPIREISASDLIKGRVDPSVLKNKLVLVGVTDPLAGSDFFTTPVASQFPGVRAWANIALDILENSWIQIDNPIFSALNWLLVFLIFPGLAILFPARKRILSLLTGSGILVMSIFISLSLFTSSHYYWEVSSHFYAWIFSLLWFAALRADPSLAGPVALKLEPEEDNSLSLLLPPSDEDLMKDLPETETSNFVTKTASGNNEMMPKGNLDDETLSGTVIEEKIPDLKGKPKPALATKATMNTMRELAGGTIIRPLGSGGMADVYLVWNPRLEVYRAVKVIKPEQPANFLTRFETEIRIFSKLDHPNIVQCYNVGEWHSLPYLEMEFVNGASLEDILGTCKTITVEQALVVGILVCRALHYAHTQSITIYGKTYKGIVHRDLKPANIMINKSGRIKLTDFGIARPGSVSLHTMDVGSVVGTLPYLAPEQLENGELTGSVDVYALGATIYEFITGERTFPQQDIPQLLNAKSRGVYKPLNTSNVPSEVIDIVNKSLSVELEKRYTTALAFGNELERVLLKISGADGFKHIQKLITRVWNS